MIALPSFQQLRFLCALAERCHFGKAAESCAVTQSTLSGGIKELEARLGVALFERSHRYVMLTPLGKEFAKRAFGLRLGGNADLQRINSDRIGDVLELHRAAIADREIEPCLDLPRRLLGETDTARIANG